MSMVGTKASAYDIAVENEDGVTIYYNYINDGKVVKNPQKGINIVQMNNGAIKKVVVK